MRPFSIEFSSEFRRISVFDGRKVDLKLLVKDLMRLDNKDMTGYSLNIGRSVGRQALRMPAFVSIIDQ